MISGQMLRLTASILLFRRAQLGEGRGARGVAARGARRLLARLCAEQVLAEPPQEGHEGSGLAAES